MCQLAVGLAPALSTAARSCTTTAPRGRGLIRESSVLRREHFGEHRDARRITGSPAEP
jgi:hypothetical protein